MITVGRRNQLSHGAGGSARPLIRGVSELPFPETVSGAGKRLTSIIYKLAR